MCKIKYPINFTKSRKRFMSSLHYNWSGSFLFLEGTIMYQFKGRDYEIKDISLYLGNISKDFVINNLKKKQSQK